MASVREQIVAALIVRLQGDGGPVADRVFRSRMENIAEEELPCISIRCGSESITPDDSEGQHRTLTLQVACLVKAESAVDVQADPLLTWVEGQLVDDETFGGLAKEAKATAIKWIFHAEDYDLVGAEMDVEIDYYTPRGAPETAA